MTATVEWNANIESDLAGYYVYHGRSSRIYDAAITVVAPTTTYVYTGLADGVAHYFAVKAYDTSMNVSDFSVEITKGEDRIAVGGFMRVVYV